MKNQTETELKNQAAESPQLLRPLYTVYADCGVGEFLWVTSNSSEVVGANVFSMMDSAEDQEIMSQELYREFYDWAKLYMSGQPASWEMPWELDWLPFNLKGMELAYKLSMELGTTADVRYRSAFNDPFLIRVEYKYRNDPLR